MNKPITISIIAVIAVVAFGLISGMSRKDETAETLGEAVRTCTVVHTTVAIGDDLPIRILAPASSRQWAIVQNPPNATNTASLFYSGYSSATSSLMIAGRGHNVGSSTVGIAATPFSNSHSVSFGHATNFPYTGSVFAITGLGSTTINVIECKTI